MKIVASPGARVAVFEPSGQIVRHRYVTAEGVYDAKIKACIAPYFEVPDTTATTDYYSRRLACGDAVPCDERGKPLAAPAAKPAAKPAKE